MFVVITLVADLNTPRSSAAIGAFSTPTVVHFCVALIVSATLSAPWHGLVSAAVALGICGVAGMVYTTFVLYWARQQTTYKPVLEDWLFHTVFPIAAYGTMTIAAFRLPSDAERSLFAVAAAVLSLVLIGIHNAWDTVTYLAVGQGKQDRPNA
jgi:hypothetical protein